MKQRRPATHVKYRAADTRRSDLDALRGLALFGVLMVNLLTLFRVSLFLYEDQFHTHPGAGCWRWWRPVTIVGLIAGLGATFGQVVAIQHGVALGRWEALISSAANVPLGLGYASGFLLLARRPTMAPVIAMLAPVGRMAFTNYISQSVVFGWLFYGYGLGWFGRYGAAPIALVGLALYGVQVAWSRWWLARFAYGPIEWLWRCATDARWLPLRRRHP